MRTRHRSAPAIVIASLLLLSVAAAPVSAHGPKVKVIASGLENPRGVAVDRHGRVYVAEAGSGGPADGYGKTGRILTIDGHHVRTFVGRLPSAVSDEGEVTGPVGVDVGKDGRVVAVVGGGPQDVNSRFDSLLRVWRGHARVVANIQAFRNGHPDGTDLDVPPNPFDSNAYGVAAIKDGKTLVTDAGGNDLLLVDRRGRVKTVAKFPNEVISTASLPPFLQEPGVVERAAEAVPTSVAVGPDGYWYVGELKGFPFTPGTSRIWRISPWARNVVCDPDHPTNKCRLYKDGFTSIVGLDFAPNGDLYVVEMVKTGVLNLFLGADTTGALWRIHHGVKTEIVPGRLTAPGGVAVGRDGSIYVSNFSVMPGAGEVLKIRR